jgi:hypothetical protein
MWSLPVAAVLAAAGCSFPGGSDRKLEATRPAMNRKTDRILVVSDSPNYYSTRDLKRLYPGQVDEHDLTSGPITAKILAPYGRVWTLVRRANNRRLLL